MIPLRIVWRDPQGLGSADAAGACKCDDGFEYALKDDRSHPLTPHNEWFCTKLAEHVGLVCPPCAVVEDGAGKFLFGSRWEGGIAKDKWWDMVTRGDIDISNISGIISRILAFDHFVYNDDRHLGNYLVRESRNNWVMLAFDFSRAWMFHGFPPMGLPFDASQNTRRVLRALVRLFGPFVNPSEAEAMLDRIQSVDRTAVEGILSTQPETWLSQVQRDEILKWWEGSERSNRIDMIRKGISDGSYL